MSILGARQWLIFAGDLVSCNNYAAYPTDAALRARHDPNLAIHSGIRWSNAHPVPWARCSCGIYAYSAPHATGFSSLTRGTWTTGSAWGLVAGWGRIVVHAAGFRAEFARPVALIEPSNIEAAAVTRAVATCYRVPVITPDQIPEFAAYDDPKVWARARAEQERRQLTGEVRIPIGTSGWAILKPLA